MKIEKSKKINKISNNYGVSFIHLMKLKIYQKTMVPKLNF